MISSDSIQEFLNRKLDDFEWVKELSPTQIDSILEESIPPNLTKGLWRHQKMMLAIMQHQSRFMIFSGLGSGKSLTILTHLRNRKIRGESLKAIVFVPYLTAVDTWINEVEKWAPELTCCPLLGSSSENLAMLKDVDADLYPVCYQTAVAMFTTTVAVYNKYKKIYENKWLVNSEVIDEYINGFDTLILDEAHRCGSHTSQTFLLCNLISQRVKWVYGLTGTPFGKDKQNLWAEFYLIDFGQTLGPNISFYRTVFFTKKNNFWGGVDFEFRKRLTRKLQATIRNKSIHFATHEMVDIPEKQYIPLMLHLHDSIRGHVERALQDLRTAIKDKDYNLVGTSFLVLRQAASGFLTFKTDEDSKERIKSKFKENPKLDALANLIEEMPPDEKMVVFHDYVFSSEMIHERLTKMKVGHSRIWGGQKDPLGELKRFREDNNCKVLVINSKSGSSALNLQFASIIVFYECPSVIDRAQAEARCWRPGQTKRVLIYDLLVKDTLDVDYYQTIREGGDLLKEFLSGKKRGK